MSCSQDLAREGVRGALHARIKAGYDREKPMCVYDLASKLGVEVRFHGGNTFGGMYCKTSETVVVPSLRPAGRQAFTCAHELGHWYFNHGDHLDGASESEELDDDPNEKLANTFASYLLMPPWAVKRCFSLRGLHPNMCSAIDLYIIACQLGVGFSTLVKHLQHALGFITDNHARSLLKTSPMQIRNHFMGETNCQHLIVADGAWGDVPIDICVGDAALLMNDVKVEGLSAAITNKTSNGTLIHGVKPGISRAESIDGRWASFIRISRRHYEGRSIYRHLEDPDDGDGPNTDLRS